METSKSNVWPHKIHKDRQTTSGNVKVKYLFNIMGEIAKFPKVTTISNNLHLMSSIYSFQGNNEYPPVPGFQNFDRFGTLLKYNLTRSHTAQFIFSSHA